MYFLLYVSYQEVFHRFDKDESGDMNLFELRDALTALGKTVTIFLLKFALISPVFPLILYLRFFFFVFMFLLL